MNVGATHTGLAEQETGALVPPRQYLFAGQAVHALTPAVAEYVPARQGTQLDALEVPTATPLEPAGQSVWVITPAGQ